ncbi:hypothetical protein [Streptomyces sp. XY413]|uniref:hypothetical protein n=1 Tax=Streptomyces sp. XY413 TaxID=1519479 RepID=UPI000ACF37A3
MAGHVTHEIAQAAVSRSPDRAAADGRHLATVAADVGGKATVRRLYLPDTAILITRFMAPGGVGEVIDFMPPDPSSTPSARHRLIRAVRVVRGSMPFELLCKPRFGYGRAPHDLRSLDDGSVLFRGPGMDLSPAGDRADHSAPGRHRRFRSLHPAGRGTRRGRPHQRNGLGGRAQRPARG